MSSGTITVRLEKLADATHCSKSFLARETIAEYAKIQKTYSVAN